MTDTKNLMSWPRLSVGMGLAVIGLLIFILGAAPSVFGLDRSSVTGFVQITVFLIGLAVMCLGGYIALNALWNGRPKSISADIGYRLIATGYVIAVASGLSDVFGFGSHLAPNIPYFGPLQALGVIIGEFIILIGFIMLVPRPEKIKRDIESVAPTPNTPHDA